MLIFVFMLLNYNFRAQAPPPPPPHHELPIDGGIFYLIIAGTIFGILRLRKNSN